MTQKPHRCPECEGQGRDPDDSLKPCPLCHGEGRVDSVTALMPPHDYQLRVERRKRRERFWKWAPLLFIALVWIVPLVYATCIAS